VRVADKNIVHRCQLRISKKALKPDPGLVRNKKILFL